MKNYYQQTFHVDSSSFLSHLEKRLKPRAAVLDIGCGSGRDLLWFKQRGYTVVGFEKSKGLAAPARKNAGCEVIEGNFETYNFFGRSLSLSFFVPSTEDSILPFFGISHPGRSGFSARRYHPA